MIPYPLPVSVPWDAGDFGATSVTRRVPVDAPLSPEPPDRKLMSKFPTPELGSFEESMTLVDCQGQILLWHLPSVLDATANVRCVLTLAVIPH